MNSTQKNLDSKKTAQKKQGLFASLFFAFMGIAFMATAIMLLPKLNTYAKKTCPDQAPCPDLKQYPTSNDKKDATNKQTDNAKINSAIEIKPAKENKTEKNKANDETILNSSPWTIKLDPHSYKIDKEGQKTIKILAHLLLNNKKMKIQLTGINNTQKSRKKAKYAASLVKENITNIERSVRKRITTKSSQVSKSRDLSVIAKVIAGGSK